ncbi:MAG: response regulator transcription factor [Herbiconiux sp.]|nr:MAG: response regulator transcription factor [Herbiconiux sp.]
MLDRAWPSLVDEHPDALRSALAALIERLQYPAAPEVTLDAVRSLSPRERKVLAELTTGDTIGTIADRLFVSRNTIKSQLHSAYRKLGVRTRAEAERAAVRHGITPETV